MVDTASVRISYSLADEDAALSIALDSEKNREIYGENKTTFHLGERVYLKITAPAKEPYTLYSSVGSVAKSRQNIVYDVTEDISFAFSSSASLQEKPRQSVDWTWYGNNGGSPLFDGKSVSLSSPVVSILHCEYTTLKDRGELIVQSKDINFQIEEELTVLVVVKQQDNTAYCTVKYSTETLSPRPIDLEISDFCSDEILSEVDVYLDGESVGKTNANGRIYLGKLIPGSIHDLKMTKSGYRDSNLDILHNDKFTVPYPEADEKSLEFLEEELARLKAEIEEVRNKINTLS